MNHLRTSIVGAGFALLVVACSGGETDGPDGVLTANPSTSLSPGVGPGNGVGPIGVGPAGSSPASVSPDPGGPGGAGSPGVGPGAGGDPQNPPPAGGNGPGPSNQGGNGGDGPSNPGGAGTTNQGGGGTTNQGGGGTTNQGGDGGGGSDVDDEIIYTEPGAPPSDENGSELWLRYPAVPESTRLDRYNEALVRVVVESGSPTLDIASSELTQGLGGLLSKEVSTSTAQQGAGDVVLGTPDSSPLIASLPLAARLAEVGPEGYILEATEAGGQPLIAVAANSDVGVLYGAFALLRHVQSHRSIQGLSVTSAPKVEHRILNHWDNLDGSVERGYAGRSLWHWNQNALPGLAPRWEDYARANASIGINGTVLTNVNANADILRPENLDRVAAIADGFRPYGIAVYLTARFSAPQEIGGMNTSDPTNSGVQQWWVDKAAEIYDRIPDFGGFLVKANSEGQPGPQDFGRTHAEGANALADAVGPHGGIVMWRAFVYSEDSPVDRIRQAYDEFQPLDGQFRDNVLVQVKNGPLDFQPREPFSPLFGATPNTPLVLELQITKEYLGQDTHLAYLGPMYEEVLQADTFADGPGSTVARVVDGSIHDYATTAIAGVANAGESTTWSGSHFNQANWYVFGRMAWDLDVSAEEVAEEWIRQTFHNAPEVIASVTEMMMDSHQALVDYMTPLGLVHIMASDHHYGPGPWVDNLGRAEWNPTYYHKANAQGIGFDRTSSGSNAVEQYFQPLRDEFASRDSVPDDFLLFFHHVGWQETMSSGRTLWEELVHRYSLGVDGVATMRDAWASVEPWVDSQRFGEIGSYLEIQHWEARWWRDACLQYFRTFANLEIPSGYAAPADSLQFYQGLDGMGCPGSNVGQPRCQQVYTGDPSPAILP